MRVYIALRANQSKKIWPVFFLQNIFILVLSIKNLGRMQPASDATAAALTAMVIDDVEKPAIRHKTTAPKLRNINKNTDATMQVCI